MPRKIADMFEEHELMVRLFNQTREECVTESYGDRVPWNEHRDCFFEAARSECDITDESLTEYWNDLLYKTAFKD